MKTIVIILASILLVISSLRSQTGWYPQVSGTSNYLYCVYFPTDNTGWVVGQVNTVLKTTNAGLNWIPQNASAPGFLYSVFFIDINTGWTVGQNGAIRKTTNSGSNWSPQVSGFSNEYLYSVFFIDANTGLVCGSQGLILRTTNGGTNWNSIPSGTTNTLSTIHFAVSATYMTGYISGGAASEGTIVKTSNQGLSWTASTVGTNWLFGIYCVSFEEIWAVGFNGTILHTTNGGTNWMPQSSGTTNRLLVVNFLDLNTGWSVGYSGTIIKTTNSGVNWNLQISGTTVNLWGLHFRNTLSGWAAGWTGTILHTTTGGVVPVKSISTSVPETIKLYQNYPNPFNPSTKIKFDIGPPFNSHLRKEGTMRNAAVVLKVYNILGKEIATLVNEKLKPGTYEIEWSAKVGTLNYPSGVYYYKLTAGEYSKTKKMLLIK
jgi:photosystem II stability/assembly factor-like uncharacterized protein